MSTASADALSVVVTGGASGIGAAVCRRVIEAGGYVAILDVNVDAATELQADLGSGLSLRTRMCWTNRGL